jgi:Tfp pilus assembly protein PilN
MRDLARQISLNAVLRSLIPASLFRPGFLLPDLPRFQVASLTLSDGQQRDLRQLSKKHGAIVVDIDKSLALTRVVKLPRAAASQADAAIRLQMRQSLPAQADGLVWQIAEAARTETEVCYTVFVMKEAVLRHLEQIVQDVGGSVREFRFVGVEGAPLHTTHTQAAQVPRRWAIGTVIGVALISLWAVWGIEADVKSVMETNATLAASNQAMEERLVALTETLASAEGARASLLSDIAVFDATSDQLKYLADLARDLPDTVWISEVSADANNMSLAGFTASDAAEVVAIVQQQPWAASVRLDGPIQYDTYTQQNRFGLVIALDHERQSE